MARVPQHIGIIPDGNRRWAVARGLRKEQGYDAGLEPGLALLRLCHEAGVKEVTYYGFTMDNTKRPAAQTRAFSDACVKAVRLLSGESASLRVLGNTESKLFPRELLPYSTRHHFGNGSIKVNFLVNYGWEWDLAGLRESTAGSGFLNRLRSADISRVDLIIRWGGRRRLSGFLPVQSIYSDFFIVEDHWPDFRPQHFQDALSWYRQQDVTLGG